jgi:cell division protein FtsQ
MAVLIVLGSLATSAFLLKTYLGRDSRFRIAGAGNIQATGLTEVSRAEMLPVFGEDIGRNIFFVPLSERRKQLEEIPWVERATVMRLLPDQIRVQVVERRPVAFVRQGQQIGLVDTNGVLLTMPAAMMAQHNYSFPVVTGIEAHDPAASRKARMAVYERLLAELDSSSQHLSEQISEIDLSDPEDARVLMPEQGADILAHFGEDRFLERYQRYKQHISEWKQLYPKLVAVDLRYDQQVVLEMAPGTNAVQATVGDQSAPDAGNVPAADGSTELALNGQAKPKPGMTSTDTGEAAQTRAAANKSDGKASAKPAGDSDSKPKTQATTDKASGDKPSRDTAAKGKSANARATSERIAASKRAHVSPKHGALNVSKKKPAATTRPTAASSKGE